MEVVDPEDVDLYRRVERSPLESAALMQLSFDVRGQPSKICDALVPDTLLGQVPSGVRARSGPLRSRSPCVVTAVADGAEQ